MATTYTPQRTQYPFAALTNEQRQKIIGVNRPLAYTIQIRDQWDTFERVENYNDIIYQKYEKGIRGDMYYQYVSDQEFKNYRAGQQFHINAYPSLPVSTFQPIRDRPMPYTSTITGVIPYETNVPRFTINKLTPSASEIATAQGDIEVYSYVSTFNAYHVLKHAFVDDVEKNAYERADLRLNTFAAT